MTDRTWHRNEDWVGSQVEDSFVMVNIETGTYVSLNATAMAVWDTLATPCTQREIEMNLKRQFDVAPETCADAVERILTEMETQQLAHGS